MEQIKLLNQLANLVLYRKNRKIKTGVHTQRITKMLSIWLIDFKGQGAEVLGEMVMYRSFKLEDMDVET